MAVRTAGSPEQIIARVEAGSRGHQQAELVTESCPRNQIRRPVYLGFLFWLRSVCFDYATQQPD